MKSLQRDVGDVAISVQKSLAMVKLLQIIFFFSVAIFFLKMLEYDYLRITQSKAQKV